MSFLSNPHLDLTMLRIETPRCVLVPFVLDGSVDIRELATEFCRANQELYVSPFLPTYEEEVTFLEHTIEEMKHGNLFENFVLDKKTNALIGAGGLRLLTTGELNIGIWICVGEHGRGYATEVYDALISWAREYTTMDFLFHAVHPENRASRRLAEKFGGVLQSEKTDRGHEIYHIPLR